MRVWLSPCPGVAFPGFFLCKRFGFARYLYRDLDGTCRKVTLFRPTDEEVFAR